MAVEQQTSINQARDLANMSELEKKHVPMIHVSGTPKAGEFFDVTVWVGEELSHPNEVGHHIEFIDLYLDDRFITRCDLTWGYSEPKVTFSIKVDGPGRLRAYERCNIHGDWTNSLDLKP